MNSELPYVGSHIGFGALLLGVFALAMQILAGHPQYVFYTGVAAALYSLLLGARIFIANRKAVFSFFLGARFVIAGRKVVLAFLAGVVLIVVGAIALTAVQLFTGLQESGETLRSTGLSYDFAAMFSFPPENVLTFLAPNFFGDMKALPYWGRCYLWEMSGFVSITGLLLAIYGVRLRTKRRDSLPVGDLPVRHRCAPAGIELAMVVILFVLALGAHTPLFKLLYHLAPGFDKFRGNSKFLFLASLFLAMFAAAGLDRVIREHRIRLGMIIFPFVLAVLAGISALMVHQGALAGATDTGGWRQILNGIAQTRESYLLKKTFADPVFAVKTGTHAAQTLLGAGGTLAIAALALLLVAKFPKFVLALMVLATIELFIFARGSRATFELAEADLPPIKQQLQNNPGDYRILNLINPNVAMSMGAMDLWGYDPGVLRRYAELMAFTQSINPDEASQYIPFSHNHPLYSMLRGRFVFARKQGQITTYASTNAMPHLQLIYRFRVLPERNAIFAALTNSAFNPREEVILESAPVPEPKPKLVQAGGTVSLVNSSTDRLTIEANLDSPAILLVTDAFSKGWRARPMAGSSQSEYHVMPANYCLRAIPLAEGTHRLQLEYLPGGYVVGKWMSIFAVAVYLGFVVAWAKKIKQNHGEPE